MTISEAIICGEEARALEMAEEMAEKIILINRIKRTKSKYGYNTNILSMESQQKGKCAICCKEKGIHGLVVDHDHKSGKVRGLLCNSCNKALGFFQDDIEILTNAINYLNNIYGVESRISKTSSKRIADRNL